MQTAIRNTPAGYADAGSFIVNLLAQIQGVTTQQQTHSELTKAQELRLYIETLILQADAPLEEDEAPEHAEAWKKILLTIKESIHFSGERYEDPGLLFEDIEDSMTSVLHDEIKERMRIQKERDIFCAALRSIARKAKVNSSAYNEAIAVLPKFPDR